MADNVQGFNHLDEVLLHLGDQFRNEAIRNKMMGNQQEMLGMKLSHGPTGKYSGMSHNELLKYANNLNSYKIRGIQQMIQASKDITGVGMPYDQAKAQWEAANPKAEDELGEVNDAAFGYMQKQNPSFLTPKPKNEGPKSLHDLGGGTPEAVSLPDPLFGVNLK
jgi:hypothetical protein